jgi:membrane associated rhomboid family serine protease
MGVADEIKLSFKNGSYLTKLIYINLAIWILIRLIFVASMLSGSDSSQILGWMALPASFDVFITRPWTLITYMFLHFEFLHILFNVLWLYWFGKIFLEYHNQRRLLSLYLLGGLSGGLVFMLAYNLVPVFKGSVLFTQLLGASASIIAILAAIAVYVPNHVIHLVFIGPVKIKWIVVISIILYVIGLSGSNAGGNFAHLGGMLWGFLYMSQLKSGRDIATGFNRITEKILSWTNTRRKLKIKYNQSNPDYEYNRRKTIQQTEINRILDKIGKSGYDSLTAEEKDTLFKMGKRDNSVR